MLGSGTMRSVIRLSDIGTKLGGGGQIIFSMYEFDWLAYPTDGENPPWANDFGSSGIA